MVMETASPPTSGSREPAPGGLRLVQELVNTADLEEGTEELGDEDSLRRWLMSQGLIADSDPITRGDVSRMRALREAIRDLLGTHAGESLGPAAAAVLERETGRCPLRLKIDPSGAARIESRCSGIEHAIATVLSAIAEASAEGTWRRLKACREHGCRWAYYDSSKNSSSAWCAMRVCGNRAKARRYRERRHSPGMGEAGS